MLIVVRNPSMQMEKFDRPMRRVNCYDNAKISTSTVYVYWVRAVVMLYPILSDKHDERLQN